MQITEELKTILLGHHYLVNNIEKVQYENYAYLNAYLLSNFGIIVD